MHDDSMQTEYERLCDLYAQDAARDLADWRSATRLLDDIVEDLRVELGLERPLREVFISSLREPDENVPALFALEANAERSWTSLLTVILKKPTQAIDWQGAYFRFDLELKHVMENFYRVTLWAGADPIRVQLDAPDTYRAVSEAICDAIEKKIRDPNASGPARFAKAEQRPPLVLVFRTSLYSYEEPIGRVAASAPPRRDENVVVAGGYYKVIDVVWEFETCQTFATVVVAPQPRPERA